MATHPEEGAPRPLPPPPPATAPQGIGRLGAVYWGVLLAHLTMALLYLLLLELGAWPTPEPVVTFP